MFAKKLTQSRCLFALCTLFAITSTSAIAEGKPAASEKKAKTLDATNNKGPFEAYEVTWHIWDGMASFFPADKVNSKIDKLTIEKWISEKPNTEGKFIMLEFWGTYCSPCLRHIPKLNALHAKYNDRIAVIGLSSEKAKKVIGFKGYKDKEGKIHQIEYYNAIDTTSTLNKAAGVKALPTTVIIDPNGKIAFLGPPAMIKEKFLETRIFKFYQDNQPKPE